MFNPTLYYLSPTVLGNEFAGVIEALGKEVKLFREGDPVFGYWGLALVKMAVPLVCNWPIA